MKSLGRLVSPEWIWINFYIHAGKNDWHVLCQELSEIYLTLLLGQPVEFRAKQVLGLLEILLQSKLEGKWEYCESVRWQPCGLCKKCRWHRLLQELWEQSLKVWISRSRVDQGRCKRPHTLDSSWDWEVARPVSPLVTGCNPIQGNSSGWLAIQKLSHIKARILSKLSCENEFYLHAGMKQSVFFLKISKEIGKLWRTSVTPRHATPCSRPFVWLLLCTWIRKNTDCFAVLTQFKTLDCLQE